MPAKNKVSSEIGRTSINDAVRMKLWAVSAGRCELCNRLLYSDLVFGADGNFSELAHIHAVSAGGPRHKCDMTQDEKNDISNLMLLCEEHHHMIDVSPEKFADSFLVDQKKRHENRIRRVTEIGDSQSCRMVSYFSNIDNLEIFSSEHLFKQALISAEMMPLQQPVIELNGDSRTRYEPSKANMEEKAQDLETQVKSWFGEIVKTEDAVGIFALAPQPLLIKLGTLINDQQNVNVFQCHRSGHKWAWGEDASSVEFCCRKSHDMASDTVALVLDLSAEIVDQRITAVLGESCIIYHLTIETPNRAFVKNRGIQDAFIDKLRSTLEQIKNENPSAEYIHVFPAMPNSLAIRAGMDYMPKADLPWKIYEQVSADNGFIETIMIGGN